VAEARAKDGATPTHAFVLLTAGRASSEMMPIFGDIPSGLVPVRGKPALMHNIKTVLSNTDAVVYVVVGYRRELIERRVFRYLKGDERARVRTVVSDPSRRPGYSFTLALDEARKHGCTSATVLLGDTLLTDEMLAAVHAGRPFIGVSRDYTDPSRWALLQKEHPLEFLEKPQDLETTDLPALIGLYHLERLEGLDLKILNSEISACLKRFAEREPFTAVEIGNWMDVGHIDSYYDTRKKFIVTRHFNRIEVDTFANTLTKSSDNKPKLVAEIDWYEGLPSDLRWVFPAVYAYDRAAPSITMEFVPYPTLDELFLYSDLHASTWDVILDKLVRLLALFNAHKAEVPMAHYADMYVGKTRARLDELARQGAELAALIGAPSLCVNGRTCLGAGEMATRVEQALPKLFAEADHSIIHGDFCFANILYSPESGALKLVDPRGAWGKPGITGDIKYDYAKLLHSISGGYDSIIADYFDLTVGTKGGVPQVEVEVFKPPMAAHLENAFFAAIPHRREAIELIEGVILASIASIHKEDPRRQMAMLAVGLEKATRSLEKL